MINTCQYQIVKGQGQILIRTREEHTKTHQKVQLRTFGHILMCSAMLTWGLGKDDDPSQGHTAELNL